MKVYEIIKVSLFDYSNKNKEIYNIVKFNLDVNLLDTMGLETIRDWKKNITEERYLTNENDDLSLEEFKSELLNEDLKYSKNKEIREQDYASFANKMNELEAYATKIINRSDGFMKSDLIMICDDAIKRSGKDIDRYDFIRKVRIGIVKNNYSINDLTNFKIN